MLPRGRILFFGLAALPYALIAAVGDQAKPTYSHDVLPVLKAHCASCHSGASASAGLDLTSSAGIMKVVKAKNSKNSPLVMRMRGIGGTQMPMGFAPLPKATIDRIAEWIDAGAVVDVASGKHWAYVKPKKPAVPKLGSTWISNPIDAFILEKLQKEGLKPSPDAAKSTLLRRVYLDLIGIPPTIAELNAFLSDKRPDAYERVVDSLLKNPHYGERQAEPWLDLSRYADSDGYEKDLNRTAWTYRDWLIKAFNKNIPYDQFTIDQIAGDLLPHPTQDDLVATGFNRNTMFNREGGVDQEDAHFNVILDRVGTTATVWLGSTLQCARCHDHKYDPFTQRDFYKMAAFFSDSQIYPEGSKTYGEEKWFESEIRVPSPQQEAQERKLKTQIAELGRRMKVWTPELQTAYDQWLIDAKKGPGWTVLQPDKLSSKNGETLKSDGFGVITTTGPIPATDDFTLAGKAGVTRIGGLSIEAIADASLPTKGPGRSDNGNFVLSSVTLKVGGVEQKLARASADFNQPQYEAPNVLGKDPNKGWAILGAIGKSHELDLDLAQPIDVKPDTPVEVTIEQHWPGGKHVLGRFRVSLSPSNAPSLLNLPTEIRKLVAMSAPTDVADRAIKDYYLTISPVFDPQRDRVAQLQSELAKLNSMIPTALVMRDKPHPGPLTAYVHSRGEFLSPTDLVTAGFPAVMGTKEAPTATIEEEAGKSASIASDEAEDAMAAKATPAPVPHINDNGNPKVTGPVLTRLDLGRWLVSRENPLTARVEVNRIWEQFFGRGIVETSEDFGTQGSRPSHPQLLDWLACEFMDRGWDMKAMVRMIVTSATYRQSSESSKVLEEKDPQNILLAHGPRVRLDAETIRDTVLAAAGLLSNKIGGPSVFPYQPAGVWDTPYNGEQWMTSKGEDSHRRGLYTFAKRSSPYPSFLDFDSTSRESCTVRRIRTNTPLQALAMLNDEVVLEAAKALGQRMQKEGGTTEIQKLAYGFRLCTGRYPSKPEVMRLDQLFKKLLARYEKDSADSKKVADSPADAAWTMVGNVLLNLDETVTKG